MPVVSGIRGKWSQIRNHQLHLRKVPGIGEDISRLLNRLVPLLSGGVQIGVLDHVRGRVLEI